jgi:SAM-dependent methyltransferase
MNNKITYWLEPLALQKLVYVHSRSFVSNFKSNLEPVSLEKLIYNEHIYIEKNELLEIIDASCKYTSFIPKGTGLELGAGCAAISVELVKRYPEVKKVYAIEIVPEIVEFAALPLIEMHKLESTIIPVVGNFDEMKVSADSIDFIVEFDSLHHSFNLKETIAESGRVLKKGGQLIAIDRSHWNTSKRRRTELENQEYSHKFLRDRGMDENKRVTRADNGEHEFLLSEYIQAFKSAGFQKIDWIMLIDPTFSHLKLSLVSLISSKFRRNTKYHYIQTWPFWKLLLPLLFMRLLRKKQFGHFVSLPREKNSKRFQAKTVIIATR